MDGRQDRPGRLYLKFSDPKKRFDRFPEAETGFYNSVKIAIALFSTIVGSYPYSHIQNWLSTNSTMNGTGQGLRNRFRLMGYASLEA